MMYNNKLVAVLKSNGKILRENKDLITLPFGSEYSILLKNLDTRKCKVSIQIDGQDVLNGHSLILNPGTEHELQGFLNGTTAKNKFKFIQKTKEISDFRGDRIDDGIIRIEYLFEKYIEKRTTIIHEHYYDWYWSSPYPYRRWYDNQPTFQYLPSITTTIGAASGGSASNDSTSIDNLKCNNIGSINNTSFKTLENVSFAYSCNSIIQENNQPLQDEGITVKGSEINQQFVYGNIGELEDNSNIIILRLKGTNESGTIIKDPITIKTKLTCKTCGKKSKSYVKYCSKCGTYLEQ